MKRIKKIIFEENLNKTILSEFSDRFIIYDIKEDNKKYYFMDLDDINYIFDEMKERNKNKEYLYEIYKDRINSLFLDNNNDICKKGFYNIEIESISEKINMNIIFVNELIKILNKLISINFDNLIIHENPVILLFIKNLIAYYNTNIKNNLSIFIEDGIYNKIYTSDLMLEFDPKYSGEFSKEEKDTLLYNNFSENKLKYISSEIFSHPSMKRYLSFKTNGLNKYILNNAFIRYINDKLDTESFDYEFILNSVFILKIENYEYKNKLKVGEFHNRLIKIMQI